MKSDIDRAMNNKILLREFYITNIHDGKTAILYKFRIDEDEAELNGNRKNNYQVDSSTGQPIMTTVTSK
ncbi:MAG TPA: hypothetical protein VGB63_11555 [Pedobacter sp.]|jgi:Ser/Thr protein kinase RdoA (MazF antagonist)